MATDSKSSDRRATLPVFVFFLGLFGVIGKSLATLGRDQANMPPGAVTGAGMSVTKARAIEQIEVDRLFLYEENSQHEPFDSQDAIIEYLCNDEQVFNPARSISEAGANPLELLGLVQLKAPVDVAQSQTTKCGKAIAAYARSNCLMILISRHLICARTLRNSPLAPAMSPCVGYPLSYSMITTT